MKRPPSLRFLIRDSDKKYTASFNNVFRSEGMKVISTPYQAPNANAFAERWVRTVREECLGKLLVINEQHLRQVMDEYVSHYNRSRTHQGIAQQTPIPFRLHKPMVLCSARRCWAASFTNTFGWPPGPFSGEDGVFWHYGLFFRTD